MPRQAGYWLFASTGSGIDDCNENSAVLRITVPPAGAGADPAIPLVNAWKKLYVIPRRFYIERNVIVFGRACEAELSKWKRLLARFPHPKDASAPSSPAEGDETTTMTLRLRRSTAEAIADSAKEQGLTMKQVICKALSDAGILVAAVDLEDRTPRRQS